MKMRIEDVVVRNRIRSNLGDLSGLMQSMKEHGLIHPILVNQHRELVTGQRRLESAKRLGWETIDAVMTDIESDVEALEVEIEENTQRRNLSPDDLADAYERLEKLRHPGILKRIAKRASAFFRRIRLGRRHAHEA